jgi:esterase/lipase
MKKLLLLHGAIGAKGQLQPLSDALKKDYEVHSINFSGHGGEAFSSSPFGIKTFAEDVLRWMDNEKIGVIDIFGYSMGGYVALYLAKHHPGRIGKIFTLATKFHWDEPTSQKEVRMLDADKIEEKVPDFAKALQKRHHPQDWKTVLSKTVEMMLGLGRKNELDLTDYESIEHSVLIGIGDKDKMVSLEETIAVYRMLKNGRLLVIPGTPHPIEKVSVERLATEAREFFG